MIHRKIIPREKPGVGWYVHTPNDLWFLGNTRDRFVKTKKEADEIARHLMEARRTQLSFFFGLPPAALAEFALRVRGLGVDRAVDALRRAVELKPGSERMMSEVVEEYLVAKRADGIRPITLESYKSSLLLAAVHKRLCDVTTADITEHVHRLDYTPLGQCGVIRRLRTFFAWAVKQKLLTESPAKDVETPKVSRKDVEILPLDDCQRLMSSLQARCPRLIPFVALQLFGGFRATEASRVTADSIKNGHIVIVGAQTKLNVRRSVPISPQLAAWLAVPGGALIGDIKAAHRELSAFRRVEKINVPHNALRHSFASYLYAAGNDVDFVSKACGNSPEILRRHYLGTCSKSDGLEFAGIMPTA